MKTFRILLVVSTALLTANFALAQTWTQTSAPETYWTAVASSADVKKLVAAADRGGIWVSTNSGINWTSNNISQYSWSCVASSADGCKLAAAAGRRPATTGPFYTSTNSGATWELNTAPNTDWFSVASSTDGNKLVAVGSQGIFTSIDSGTAWASTNTSEHWETVASSADGTKLVAGVGGVVAAGIYTSTNSGMTWASNSVPVQYWISVASSADGTKLVAVARGGGIWTSQSTPAPQLNLAPLSSNLAVSWIIPSTDFMLQQNLDLTTTNWTDLTNTPGLNLTNLQDEVILTPTNSSSFYRLKTP
jgi:hypothetical protein